MKLAICYLSKLKDKQCEFKEIKLASSALGENILKFWDTPGRIHIDLLKDIQKTYNLTSYKLDDVASTYIRGEIIGHHKLDDTYLYELECVNVNDININDYIHIEQMKGFVSDYIGNKYLVSNIDINNKKINIIGNIDLEMELNSLNNLNKIYWSQAKDDVSPKEIFAFQKQGPSKRAIIAKYCIKDCSLVNLLINKLEVVTKNLEMANVCYVPLSYLFIRGQGIKLFSLCLKEFRDQNYIFPVIKVKKDSDGNLLKEESYEGAIVFDPIPQIEYEANTTKDYASLYPSADIHKNMSHETEVTNPKYDNIEGVTYFNSSFKDNEGQTINLRFAKIGDKLGVIPTILTNLLKERKNVKKIMNGETDAFKYKILDAKQLALKTTANSLYGQLGAGTSPIANRNIAASITSTGREMLLFAKKYDEEILPWIINGLKEALLNNDEILFNKIVNLELKNKDAKFIEKLRDYCANIIKDYNLQPVVRYGDSVAKYTPIYVKVDNYLDILEIDQIAIKYGNNNWCLCLDSNKEVCNLKNVETWTELGWTKLDRIIRHHLPSDKKMFRIVTESGLVDVTDDHSLISNSGALISPKDIIIGDELLHSKLPVIDKYVDNIDHAEARLMGLFFSSGKCTFCPINNINIWSLAYSIYNLSICRTIETKFDWINCIENKTIIITSNEIINKYFVNMYYKNCKIIPFNIINGSYGIRKAFFDELLCGDPFYIQEHQITTAYFYWLAASVNILMTITIEDVNTNTFRLTKSSVMNKKIKNIIKIDYNDYVYDLTTSNHHFAAGIGNMIVHNTDSIFTCFRFKEQKKELNYKKSLNLFDKIIKFGKELIKPFFLDSDKQLFEKLYDQYYKTCDVLTLPNCPVCMDIPNDYRIILPVEERMKQFLKEYLYENYISWLWNSYIRIKCFFN